MSIPIEFVAEAGYGRDPQFVHPSPIEQNAPGRAARGRSGPVGAFRAWPDIRARLKSANAVAIFLDFDGTLVGLKRRPEQVRLPPEVRRLLRRIARHRNVTVVIASGRRVRDLKRLIGLKQLRYFGVHGAENEDRALTIPAKTRAALRDAHAAISAAAAQLSGVWIEPKGVTFAVHYRGAQRPAIERIQRSLSRVVDKNILRILKGKGAWEVLPREIVGKSTIVEEIVREIPDRTAVVYIGDDETDEVAFRARPDDITVVVGQRPGTRARYSLVSPAAVGRFLARLEKELR